MDSHCGPESRQGTKTMDLDPTRCYQAVLSRDARFDGRFFGGVVTTGVYCRPICPVRPPKPENVRWFACAAAAEAAGFRPCRRCRPETSPGTPAWIGTSAVVSRALRLIAEGALDDENVEGVAGRLGMGARQLRRLFDQHLGASPLEVARARRVHFARRLLDESDLPVTAIAFSSGFGSIRQFNHAMRATFGRPPSVLRRQTRRGGSTPDGGGLTVRLQYRPPFDWATMIGFLAVRATPGVEEVGENVYRRTIAVDGATGVIDVRPDERRPCLHLRVLLPRYDGLIQVVERARRLFDLGADPLRISSDLRRSPSLALLVDAQPGTRVPGAWEPFELAVRAVLGQQITVRGATTLAGRLVRAFGQRVAECGGLTHLFPKPETLAEADLAGIGLPRARAATLRALAVATARRELVLDATQGLDDAVARLSAVPGIGPWTAHYIAMRALGEPDAFPVGDLGLRRALGNSGAPLPTAELAQLAEDWRPWRAYAAMILWTAKRPNGNDDGRRRNRHSRRVRRETIEHRPRRPEGRRVPDDLTL